MIEKLINPAQGAFIKGRRISDNILLAQELFRGYHKTHITPRCGLKVDIKKAYDSISWKFIEEMLLSFNFPNDFLHLVMECVRTAKYSISINGSLEGDL